MKLRYSAPGKWGDSARLRQAAFEVDEGDEFPIGDELGFENGQPQQVSMQHAQDVVRARRGTILDDDVEENVPEATLTKRQLRKAVGAARGKLTKAQKALVAAKKSHDAAGERAKSPLIDEDSAEMAQIKAEVAAAQETVDKFEAETREADAALTKAEQALAEASG